MIAVAPELDLYRAGFERLARERREPAWLRDLRTEAMARFSEVGFPTPRDEAWRHTSVAPIARLPFRLAEERTPPYFPEDAHAVFVNGRLARLAPRPPDGVEIVSLREAVPRLEPYLGRVAAGTKNPFEWLNTSFFEDGAAVLVSPGAVVDEPLHLLFLSTEPGAVSFPRSLVVIGRGAEARVVESYEGVRGGYLTCALTEAVVEDDAGLDHYRLQREGAEAFQVATLAVRQQRASRFSDHSFSLGAALSRVDIRVLLDGEGGDCALFGLFMADGERHTDTHTLIDHVRPHCTSRELYKGVMDDKGRAVFHGRIVVRKGAQKTDALQTNKNLLLSREALVNSTPQLEILADDVKCKHGSTTGQLDPAALFYLRSRGLPEEAARRLLTYAFADEVVRGVKAPAVREAVLAHLQRHLPGALPEAS